MPVSKIRSRWDSGNLIFHESSTLATIGNVLTLGTTAVTVGSATNDVDFKIFMGAADQYAEFNCGTATLTITKVDVALAGDLTVTLEDISVVQGKYIYFEGQAGASYIISDTAGDLMLNTTTNINFAFGDTDEVRLTASALYPVTDDGNALGVANTNEWSDLFLASAGVIGWNNSNCAITHAAGVLTVTGDIVASNAAGPAFEDEAATTTNPTLCPNKADLTTGIGWNTAEIHFVVSGVDEVNLSATALSPGVTNSTALGTTALMWSDLFLADAGVINWNNGDTTLTATGNLLTLGASGLSVGASGAGFDVIFYGDTPDCNFFWDQNLDTNGALVLGADTKATHFYAYGLTTGNYLKWDAANDDLLLVGTATQFAVAGTANATTTTSGSIRTAGGLAVVLDTFLGGFLNIQASAGETLIDFVLETEWTGGTLIDADFGGATTQASDAIGMFLDFESGGNFAGVTDLDITGYRVTTPIMSQTPAVTTTYIGFDLPTAGALTQSDQAGTIQWTGYNVQLPNTTQTTGTVTAYGVSIASGTYTSGTMSGIYFSAVQMNYGIQMGTNAAALEVDASVVGTEGMNISLTNIGNASTDIVGQRVRIQQSTAEQADVGIRPISARASISRNTSFVMVLEAYLDISADKTITNECVGVNSTITRSSNCTVTGGLLEPFRAVLEGAFTPAASAMYHAEVYSGTANCGLLLDVAAGATMSDLIKITGSGTFTNFLHADATSALVGSNNSGGSTLDFTNWRLLTCDLDGNTYYLVAARTIADS